ncbi:MULTISPECIES: 7-carboxy-7-deazaguanine synthase QueE [unclassified Frankia]|uniref:7-carboxy-7-deazaguanine synthase QueE n=1 Tax=unclassified Frankia TaxID=2632575 RepID=UPI001EF5B75F|nr:MULTISPECIES: 7-carboxy-7-deazaguanine synthase QueE [unclassified Frankia]
MSVGSSLLSTTAEEARGVQVVEMFGPTFQGEGPRAGQQALFIRLAQCNLACGWCDSRFTWDWTRYDPRKETRRLPTADIAEWVLARPTPLVVITGGEPLLQQQTLVPLVGALAQAGRRVEVETNGTITPSLELVDAVTTFNVSPKLAHAGGRQSRRLDSAALHTLAGSGKAAFKFVLTGPGDLDEVAAIVDRFALAPVWVMPEATDSAGLVAAQRELADVVLARGWNLSTRLHVLLWEDTRGR